MSQARFPRGLIQPEGSYRFGLEALLLAAFAARMARGRAGSASREMAVAELGSGCGAAILGLGLSLARARCLGLEREAALVDAARANARALGLTDRVRFCVADLAAPLPVDAAPQDMVIANPPWGLCGSGRASPQPLLEAALRGVAAPTGDAFPLFCRAAARLLRHKGAFCCIAPAHTLPRICAALDGSGLGMRRILPLRPHTGESCQRLLLLAQKGAAAEPEICSPLTLHSRPRGPNPQKGPLWTRQALAFCPWLAASPAGDAP